jgi:hypothetical protein
LSEQALALLEEARVKQGRDGLLFEVQPMRNYAVRGLGCLAVADSVTTAGTSVLEVLDVEEPKLNDATASSGLPEMQLGFDAKPEFKHQASAVGCPTCTCGVLPWLTAKKYSR